MTAIALAALAVPGRPAAQAAADERRGEAADVRRRSKSRRPPTYKAKFDTSAGIFVVEVHRDWAPLGADRFYNLVKNGFYDDVRFFRVLDGFMAQFGMNGDPGIQGPWSKQQLQGRSGEAEQQAGLHHVRARPAPELADRRRCSSISRTTRRSTNRASRRSARSSEGMNVVDKLYSGYGRSNVPDQGRIIDRRQRVPDEELSEARLRQEGDHRALGTDRIWSSGHLVIWSLIGSIGNRPSINPQSMTR